MKITISKEELSQGVQTIQSALSSRTTLPILLNFLMETEDKKVKVVLHGDRVEGRYAFFATGGRIPSYLGSSFAFIGPVIAVTGASITASACSRGLPIVALHRMNCGLAP